MGESKPYICKCGRELGVLEKMETETGFILVLRTGNRITYNTGQEFCICGAPIHYYAGFERFMELIRGKEAEADIVGR